MTKDLGDLSEGDLIWDLSYSNSLSKAMLDRMRQTRLSRISYHRAVARNSGRLRLSQAIGLLLWMNRYNLLTEKGEERLLFLQSKASFEAIEAGLKFAQRLDQEEKLQLDFFHHMVDQNTRPSSKRLRIFRQPRRIGVGYRDKGALPNPSNRARKRAEEEAWIPTEDLHKVIHEILSFSIPPSLIEGEWINLPGYIEFLRESNISQEKIDTLLTLL